MKKTIQKIIAVLILILTILALPVIIVSFIFHLYKLAWEAGKQIFDELDNWLDKD